MKEQILKILSGVLSSIVVMISASLLTYFMKQPITIFSCLIGVIAFILLSGALEFWENKFKHWFKIDDEEI